VLTGIVMGGALSQTTMTDQRQYNSSMAISIAAKASFDILVVSGAAGISSDKKSAAAEFQKHSESTYQAVGGEPTLRAGAAGSKAKFDKWVASIPKDPALIDFTSSTWPPLVPVWKLAETAARQKELKKAYESYAQSISARFDLIGPVVGKLTVINSPEEDGRRKARDIKPPAPFEKIDVDLNRGADDPASGGRPFESANGVRSALSDGQSMSLSSAPRTDRQDRLYEPRLEMLAVPG
jgi:hypothetical protein